MGTLILCVIDDVMLPTAGRSAAVCPLRTPNLRAESALGPDPHQQSSFYPAQNLLALVPLALLLGEVTEDLAARFGTAVGALLNITFGNSVELMLSVAALQRGLYDVVAASLVGSVLSNLLLVLGTSPSRPCC